MISPASLPVLTGQTTYLELVGGTRDGHREVVTLDDQGEPDATVVHGGQVYVRRPKAERCVVDGIRAWHYDAALKAQVVTR